MNVKLELISFKLCPFVQRAVIVLKHKQIDFSITYIDLQNPPDWFQSISPLGQVPVLKIGLEDREELLFESAVIQEYVDEITPPRLHPADPLIKAKNRAWMSFGSEILFAAHTMVTHKEAGVCAEKATQIEAKLQQLEAQHSGGDFFNGSAFQLIDASYAPLLMRLDLIEQFCGQNLLAKTPKLAHWSRGLAQLPSVQQSVVEDFPLRYRQVIVDAQGHYAQTHLRG
ncbi:MAG: glutathione S-transferase family protein [Thiotrichales bacterium]|nr:glutathione S-transferase family protein [Thiotrichales bacterium]